MKLFRFLIILIVFLVIAAVSFLIYLTMNQYSPEDIVEITNSQSDVSFASDEISILTWNIGFAGMDEYHSFYLDGGDDVSISGSFVSDNLMKIKNFIKDQNTDLIILQEVDKNSSRTADMDQDKIISEYLNEYFRSFVYDFKINFYPLPLDKMIGKLHSGFLTLAKYQPQKVFRYRIIKEDNWPANIFSKDECVLSWEYVLANGKKLIVYNLNMSGYTDEDLLLKGITYIRGMMLDEYLKGNYVLAGGDWGITLPGYRFTELNTDCDSVSFSSIVKNDWTPAGWTWVYSNDIPSVRSPFTPYGSDTCFSSTDGFLISPNLQLKDYEFFDLGFKNSDHNPLKITVEIQ